MPGVRRELVLPRELVVFRTSTARVGTATDLPVNSVANVMTRRTPSVTISSIVWNIAVRTPQTAEIAPQIPVS